MGVILGCALTYCTSTSSGESTAEIPTSVKNDKDYFPVFEKWTQEAHVYLDLQKRIDMYVTLLGQDFRGAFSQRWQKLHGSSPFTLEGNPATHVGAFLSIYTPDRPYQRLDDAKVWTFELSLGDKKYIPMLVKRAAQKSTEKVAFEGFFPYINSWSTEYFVLFELVAKPTSEGKVDVPGAGPETLITLPVTLSARSNLARMDFVWK